jgi:hypothetical protein
VCPLRLPRHAPRNAAHESAVTRPQSAASANAISNFAEADVWGVSEISFVRLQTCGPGNYAAYRLVAQLGYMMTAPDPSKPTVELEECLRKWPGPPDGILIQKGSVRRRIIRGCAAPASFIHRCSPRRSRYTDVIQKQTTPTSPRTARIATTWGRKRPCWAMTKIWSVPEHTRSLRQDDPFPTVKP